MLLEQRDELLPDCSRCSQNSDFYLRHDSISKKNTRGFSTRVAGVRLAMRLSI